MAEKVLGIIPARGGSSRVKDKNIRDVGGRPLIAHTIEQVKSVSNLDKTIVSTDNSEIAEIAESFGGDVPFFRPDELATDTASSSSVVTHALDWFEKRDEHFDVVCLLQTTSPLRNGKDIEKALNRFLTSEAASLVSISEYTEPPQFAVQESESGYLEESCGSEALFSEGYTREQDLTEVYYPNGAIFISNVQDWRANESFYTDTTIGFEMPPKRSLQIDELWELELVDSYMNCIHD